MQPLYAEPAARADFFQSFLGCPTDVIFALEKKARSGLHEFSVSDSLRIKKNPPASAESPAVSSRALFRNTTTHVWNWDFFLALATMAGVKLLAMAWFRMKD